MTPKTSPLNVSSLAVFSSEKYCRVPIEGTKGLIRLLCFQGEQGVALHTHPNSDEWFFVVEGRGRVRIDRDEQDAEPGSIFHVPAGIVHRWQSGSGKLILLSMLVPISVLDAADEATEQKFD